MQNLSLSVSAPGLKKSPKVDPLLEALEVFLNEAWEEPVDQYGKRSSSPTLLNVSFDLKLQSQKEPKDVANLSFSGSWTPSRSTQPY